MQFEKHCTNPKVTFTVQPSILKEDTVNRIQMVIGLRKLELGRECDIMEPDMSSSPYLTTKEMCDQQVIWFFKPVL